MVVATHTPTQPPPRSICSPPILSPCTDQITTLVLMFKLPTVPTGPLHEGHGNTTVLLLALRPTAGTLRFLRGWGTGQVCRFPGTPFKTKNSGLSILFNHQGASRGVRVASEVPWAGYLCPHPRPAPWASPLAEGQRSLKGH